MLNVSVIGLGNAGSQVAALAMEKLGVAALAINSSEKDLQTIPSSVPHVLIGDTKGAGKERSAAKKFLKDSIMTIINDKELDKIFDVDVKGTFLTSKAFLPTMIEQDHGSIVNISSVSGMAGDRAMVAYNAAKGAIVNMTRAMAIDYGKNNIRVNVVAPGPTNTPLFHQDKQKFAKNSPLNRIVEPEEVAAAIYFVASPAASAITGEVIPVTAGFEISTGQPM